MVKNLEPNKQQKMLDLLAQAANETIEGIVISDARQKDYPIIYANDGFVQLTGYSKEEVLGRNCRFLQGPNTSSQAAQLIRHAIHEGKSCKVDILNYRKDGSQFWNRLSITPIFDADGQVSHFVGVQFDITELKETRDQLQRANKDLLHFKNEFSIELEQARRAQQAILPKEMPRTAHFTSAAKFVPLTQIGGDFYDVVHAARGIYGFLIADVTGHGIPAALLTFMSATAFKNAALGIKSTCDVIADTNSRIVNKMTPGAFVSMFYMTYNQQTRELRYTQAGHPPAILVRVKEKSVSFLGTQGSLVGIFPNEMVSYGEDSVILEPGDKVILYTDAIIETIGHKREGKEQALLVQHIKKNMKKPVDELLDSIYHFALKVCGTSTYQDDATLLGLQILDNEE